VDVFDAMIHKRRYRDPIPIEQTLQSMQENAGREFDPDIIRVFMRIYRNFIGF
jgi:putative two-component system response regulator